MTKISATHSTRYPRRSPEQWRAIIHTFHRPSLSGKQFCAEQGVGYASFCKWRRQFADPTVCEDKGDRHSPAIPPTVPTFIDLSGFPSASPNPIDTAYNISSSLSPSLGNHAQAG